MSWAQFILKLVAMVLSGRGHETLHCAAVQFDADIGFNIKIPFLARLSQTLPGSLRLSPVLVEAYAWIAVVSNGVPEHSLIPLPVRCAFVTSLIASVSP